MLRRILLLISLFSVIAAHAQLPLGATRQEVIDLIGWPSGTSGNADRQILSYPHLTVLLVDGRVARVDLKPGAKAPATGVTWPSSPKKAVPVAPPNLETSAQKKSPANVPFVAPAPLPRTEAPQPRAVRMAPSEPPPRVDLFAPVRKMIYLLGAVFVVIAGLSISRLIRARRKRAARDLEDVTTWSDSAAKPAQSSQRQGLRTDALPRPPRPDPLKDGWSLELLKSLEWHRFEQVVAEYYRRQGFLAELTSFGADGGVDVEVFRAGESAPFLLVQCKAWSNGMVGVAPVRELFGIAASRKIAGTAFFATSGFYPDALNFAKSVGMEWIDGLAFIERIKQLPLADQLGLHEFSTEGDYRTPTCVQCGIKLILRTAGKGRREGNDFYGCRNYPRCQKTINLPRAT